MSVRDDIPPPEAVNDPEFSLSDALGFCPCGRPADAHAYILGGLRLIERVVEYGRREEYGSESKEVHRKFYAEWDDAVSKHFGSQGSAYFFWYWADAEGLTEHGSSVPGWLTERGEQLVALLDAAVRANEAVERAERGDGVKR